MKTVLITAYAVNPYKGSEDGTGWNIARHIAKTFNVILITRENNIPHLEKYFSEHPSPELENITFYGFDLSKRVMKVKKKLGSKAHVIYYYLWQSRIIRFINSHSLQFDATMCLNFHSDSHPSFLWKLGKPSVWGPIGHHPKVPIKFLLKPYGWKSYLIDRSFAVTKRLMRRLPAFKKSLRNTDSIFVINSTIGKTIGASPKKTNVLPAVASPISSFVSEQTKDHFTVLSSGRFHFIKGFDISIRAFAKFYHQLPENERSLVELKMVGSGPEEFRLKALAKQLGVQEAITWIGWISHSEMLSLYQRSSVFLFPSHEGAGMVVPEAMSFGIPVLTFDNCGPGELMGVDDLKVPYLAYEESVHLFTQKLVDLYQEPEKQIYYGNLQRERQQEMLTWTYKETILTNELIRLTNTTN